MKWQYEEEIEQLKDLLRNSEQANDLLIAEWNDDVDLYVDSVETRLGELEDTLQRIGERATPPSLGDFKGHSDPFDVFTEWAASSLDEIGILVKGALKAR